MSHRKSYHTRQKDLILSCLRENKSRPVSVEAIRAYLQAQGDAVGLTTIYRNLNKLEKEGAVIKFIAPDSMCARYQYLADGGGPAHGYHLICVNCGQTAYLDCRHMEHLGTHMQEEHGFNLDRGKTVLYGRCAGCHA